TATPGGVGTNMAADEPQHGYITQIFVFLEQRNDTSFDFTQPYIRRSMRYVYPLFMFLYAAVGLVGFIGNVALLVVTGKRRLYQDQTYFFMGNLAFSDLIKCVIVLPISLANMLVQNWIFGSFLCFFLPMIQFFPIHASMLTFLMIAIDRYRLIVNPFKDRLPAGLCVIATWVGAICFVLPHAVYIKYIDLGALLGERFTGVGICYVNMEKHIEEYFRAMFVTLYALPLAIIGFLFVKISAELKSKETAPVIVHYNIRTSAQTPRGSTQAEDFGTKVTWANDTERRQLNGSVAGMDTPRRKEYPERATQDSDDDLDIAKEKTTQNYLIAMVTFFAMCWCPMYILILVHYFVHETEDNTGHMDVTFVTFAWFGYLSTCANPILFATWRLPSSTKDRLKGYFRFSNRRRSSSQTKIVNSYDFYNQ
ncbi:NPY5R-like protein, partial [Mya arenaria]